GRLIVRGPLALGALLGWADRAAVVVAAQLAAVRGAVGRLDLPLLHGRELLPRRDGPRRRQLRIVGDRGRRRRRPLHLPLLLLLVWPWPRWLERPTAPREEPARRGRRRGGEG